MSCTVAPLTTTVMGSLPNRYSGTASGINNAVTRIAGVFANAIMGALAILFFSTCLHSKMDMLSISTNAKQAIAAQSINLGDAKVPDIISSESKSAVKELYRQSFIYSYGNIMKICGALGFLASIMAFIFIKNEEVKVKESNG